MCQMQAFGQLDEVSAAMRLLHVLSKVEHGLGVMELYEAMKKEFNVGRGATDTARRTCEMLGLVETKQIDIGSPRPVLVHSLTSKGLLVAEKILEISDIMQN